MDDDEAHAVATLLAGTRGSPTSPTSKSSPKQAGINKRWRITPKALELLECVYAQEACPSTATRDVLALQLGATPRQVQVWFQNKRQRRAGKAKREQEAGGDGHQMKSEDDDASPLPEVPETMSTAALTGAGAAPNFFVPVTQQPSPGVVTPPYPASLPGGATRAVSPPERPPPLPTSTTPGHASTASTASQPRVVRGNSLADLASVAECVDSLEHLTGGLNRVNSLKDLMQLSKGSVNTLSKDLASLSKVVSLADLASMASTLGAAQQVAGA